MRKLTVPRHPATLHDIGTWLFAFMVLVVAGAVTASFAMNTAADDLRLQVDFASGAPLDHPRSPPGPWLSAPLSAEVPRSDLTGLRARADQLDHRAERVREAAGVAALLGLVLMLLTGPPETGTREAPEASSPLANTRSNGSV